MTPNSTKPYLIRALHDWCVDSGYTPYLVVFVDERSEVPTAYVEDNQIVLNISPLATNKLDMGNEYINFSARFGGVEHHIIVAIDAVMAIFARETGEGMSFELIQADYSGVEKAVNEDSKKKKTKPEFKLV